MYNGIPYMGYHFFITERGVMDFKKLEYKRPDLDTVKKMYETYIEKLKEAKSFEEAKQVCIDFDAEGKHVDTQATIASIRHSIDTRDEFYEKEEEFWNSAEPELAEYGLRWTEALLDSPFRNELAKEFGEIIFTNAEIAKKSFSPEIIGESKEVNELVTKYEKLLATIKIPFEGKEYTMSQFTPFKTDPDDDKRLLAWKAEGKVLKDNQAEMDELYDSLVKLRDAMGHKMGYEGYTSLGYYRMKRNCYDKNDVKVFRDAVIKYLVPVVERIYKEQAKRLGKEYPMSYADNALEFRSGNPKPQGTPDDILAEGKKFYDALSPETSEFYNTMLNCNLMDVLSTEGKRSGGYCTAISDEKVPFIFANFNGTQHDVEVVTHEAGHAFAYYMNRDRVPSETCWPSMESCEVHSMSMEFFGWNNAEGFFGPDAKKFRYSHLAGALKFIPYGSLVDAFQHYVYENPTATPKERHAEWKRLQGIYMPWVKLDGDIPFYGDGEAWQRQHHIYSLPFYYIDYCLAQIVALQFWALREKDPKDAWEKYMAYTKQGGSATFVDLLKNAGLESPFGEECMKNVCEAANKWLDEYDMTNIS